MSAYGAERTRDRRAERHVPTGLGGMVSQLRWDILQQLRNPAAVFFTLALPLLFLVAFAATSDDAAKAADYYVPATMALAVASGTLTNLAVTLTYLREYGQLKRVLVTPLPRSSYLGSRIVAAGLVALTTCVVLGIVGLIVYDAAVQQVGMLVVAVLLTLAVGSALGVLCTVMIRSETAAAPIANAIGLPLMLASGVFFPLDSTPQWFENVARYLPFTRSVELGVDAYAGTATSTDLLAAVAVGGIWALVAGAPAVRLFTWAPMKRR